MMFGSKLKWRSPNGCREFLPMAKAPVRLKRRADFLRARRGKQAHARGFVVQAIPRLPAAQEAQLQESQPRFGFTVSKRCGKAVSRNRIRRRLKEALRLLNPLPAGPSYDYVIVARPEARGIAFCALQADLARAIGKVTRSNDPSADRAASRMENAQLHSPLARTSQR
jgi:ribonuclease P protein component